jgi:hypothetical protein
MKERANDKKFIRDSRPFNKANLKSKQKQNSKFKNASKGYGIKHQTDSCGHSAFGS